ncbi:MAG: hypothetical protein QOC60_259, partial [Frankiaceae bacterium]|nr:hypothetical protein [Frankiaceae bacterium]
MPRSRVKNVPLLDSTALIGAGGSSVIDVANADVGATRETERQARLRRLAVVLLPIGAYMWFRILSGNPMAFGVSMDPQVMVMAIFFGAMLLIG